MKIKSKANNVYSLKLKVKPANISRKTECTLILLPEPLTLLPVCFLLYSNITSICEA